MLRAAYAVIGALVIWIIFRECSSPPVPLPPSIQARMDTVRLDQVLIESYRDSLNDLRSRRSSDSLKSKSRERAFKIENTRLLDKLVEARKVAPAEVLADPIVLIQDTLINQQADRIDELETEKDQQRVSFTASLRVTELQFNAQKDISDQLNEINADLFKTLNRERRRGKVWKVAVPVALVVGFVIGEEL